MRAKVVLKYCRVCDNETVHAENSKREMRCEICGDIPEESYDIR